MMRSRGRRATIDTNVLFEGVTAGSSAARVTTRAWLRRRFRACVSNWLAYEYLEVLGRLGPVKRALALRVLVALLKRCEWVPIWYSVRPLASDPDDDGVIDCAVNSGSVIVTENVRHVRVAQARYGCLVLHPTEFNRLLERAR